MQAEGWIRPNACLKNKTAIIWIFTHAETLKIKMIVGAEGLSGDFQLFFGIFPAFCMWRFWHNFQRMGSLSFVKRGAGDI